MMHNAIFDNTRWPIRAGLILLAIVLFGTLASLFYAYTVDDAFITFRYARNLVAGLGPVFNPGERVEGYTTFLWMLLMSAGLTLGIDPVVLSKVLGLVCGLATIGVTMAIARYTSDRPWRVAILAGLLLGASVDLALNSVTGLETAFFTLLVTAAIARQMHEEQGEGWPISSLLFGLAALTRPEGLALGGLSWLYQLVRKREHLGRALLRGLPFFILVGIHFVWRYSYYGELLPNTYYAKSIPLVPKLVVGLLYVARFFVNYGLIFPVAWFFALRQGNRRLRYLLYMSAIAVAIVIWEGGDWMQRNRFLVPILPLFCLITADVLSTLYDQIAAHSRRLAQGLAVLVAIIYLASNAAGMPYLHLYTSLRARGYQEAHLRLAKWLDETLPADESVALMDIGVVGYYTDLRIIDVTGLTDKTIGHSPGVFLSKDYDVSYVLDQSPAVIVLVSWEQSMEPAYHAEKAIFAHPKFQEGYSFDHKLEHYHDPELGNYYLMIFRRN
jgi:arabinofuranosyltransferase